MKKLLQKLNILKTESQKKIEHDLKIIDQKKQKEKNILIKKSKESQKINDEFEGKCHIIWKKTFFKDFEFKNELLTIAKHVEKNTKLDIYLEYSNKDETRGYTLFIIGNMNVHLSVKDEKTFNISTYSNEDGMDDGVDFDLKDILKCKEFFKKQVYVIYDQET